MEDVVEWELGNPNYSLHCVFDLLCDMGLVSHPFWALWTYFHFLCQHIPCSIFLFNKSDLRIFVTCLEALMQDLILPHFQLAFICSQMSMVQSDSKLHFCFQNGLIIIVHIYLLPCPISLCSSLSMNKLFSSELLI